MKISKKFDRIRILQTGCIVLVILILITLSIKIAPEVITVSSNSGRKIPIYSVDIPEKKVSLSFDAAWGNDDTDDLLRILEKYNIKTTFFLVGGWVERYPEDVKRIAAAGHDIGNHSENHKHMSQLSKEQSKKDLMEAHQKVKDLIGKDMDLFRPPYGDYNNTLLDAAKECGYYTIQWDVDSLDWKDFGRDHIVKTVLNHKNLQNGSIILMHNNATYAAAALEEIIVGLLDKGYKIVPLSELIHRDNYTIDHTGRQISNKK